MSDRAVSTAVTWALTLLITTLLITGILVATGGQIENRTESVTRTEMQVVGQQVAADIEVADRLVQSGGDTVVVRTYLPRRVASGAYDIVTSVDGGNVTVVVESSGTSVSVPVANRTPVETGSVRGGDVEVALEGGTLEVRTR